MRNLTHIDIKQSLLAQKTKDESLNHAVDIWANIFIDLIDKNTDSEEEKLPT